MAVKTPCMGSIDSMWVVGIPTLQEESRQVLSPSKRPGAAIQSRSSHPPISLASRCFQAEPELNCNARNLFFIYTARNLERVSGKHKKLRIVRKSAACLNPRDEEEKIRKNRVDGLDPIRGPVPCADSSQISRPCCRPATILPLLTPSHTSVSGGGNLGSQGSHNSPQSSWSN